MRFNHPCAAAMRTVVKFFDHLFTVKLQLSLLIIETSNNKLRVINYISTQ